MPPFDMILSALSLVPTRFYPSVHPKRPHTIRRCLTDFSLSFSLSTDIPFASVSSSFSYYRHAAMISNTSLGSQQPISTKAALDSNGSDRAASLQFRSLCHRSATDEISTMLYWTIVATADHKRSCTLVIPTRLVSTNL
ncbi:hypothetical protein TIFTF001_028082 [Ficus carica]|uniref:Uncharacterized protein n=1 Tax=Ficus carica TaxID=3494 RepID=A0AA88J0Z6_FICCA|nr:hypothetical protein TIFTF001_028082 [Ficus carica]